MSIGLVVLVGGLLVAYLALLAWMMSPDARAKGEALKIEASDGEATNGEGSRANKVAIRHKDGKTVGVDGHAWLSHQRRGDTEAAFPTDRYDRSTPGNNGATGSRGLRSA